MEPKKPYPVEPKKPYPVEPEKPYPVDYNTEPYPKAPKKPYPVDPKKPDKLAVEPKKPELDKKYPRTDEIEEKYLVERYRGQQQQQQQLIATKSKERPPKVIVDLECPPPRVEVHVIEYVQDKRCNTICTYNPFTCCCEEKTVCEPYCREIRTVYDAEFPPEIPDLPPVQPPLPPPEEEVVVQQF